MVKTVKVILPIFVVIATALFLFQWKNVEKVDIVSNASQEFEKAVVTEVLQDNLQEDGSRMGNQQVRVKFLSGKRKGKEVEAVATNGNLYGATCQKGMKVVTITNQSGELEVTSVYSMDREWIIWGFVGVFFLLLWVIGGKNGLKAVFGLVVTFIFVLFFLFPAIYRGISPVTAAIITVIASTIFTIFILTGYSMKSYSAMLGTISGVIIAGIASWGFGKVAHITGYNVSNIDTLVSVGNMTKIQVGDLLFAGILISSLGAVMDVGLSIASTITEIHQVDQTLSWKKLFISGMNVGKDMMGTMSNTLVLAFTGGSLSELILDYAYNLPYEQLINSYTIGIEIMQGVAGSIGIILTVPMVSLIAAVMITRVKTKTENTEKDSTATTGA